MKTQMSNEATRVLDTLEEQGPLCESQLSVETLIRPARIQESIVELALLGLIEPKRGVPGTEQTWRLVRPHLL